MAEIGSVLDGKYEILKEIGRGGMSVVYLAMDTRLNKQWAVKEIRKRGNGRKDQVAVNSLLVEANLMKKLDHPALPRIVDILDDGRTIFIIMDYIEGRSLDRVLKEKGPAPEEKVTDWAMQLSDALGYLHSQKPPIIYRDLKPGNIMLKPEGTVKIIDFGIAREFKGENLSDTTALGTEGYAAPEQYSGQTDERSDIYALGMTMHHLLTGADPKNAGGYKPARQYDASISEGIEAIINKCVEPAAQNRYQSCGELLRDLRHPELVTKGYRKKRRRKILGFAAVLSFAVITFAGGITCKAAAVKMNNTSYEALVGREALAENVESFNEAIDIYPGRAEAYLKLVETYENEGGLSSEDYLHIFNLYENNKTEFDPSSEGFAQLNYRLGRLIFALYLGNDGESGISERVQRAYPFFLANHENAELSADFADSDISECYYRMCVFYNDYILDGTTFFEDASEDDYEELLTSISDGIEKLEGGGNYDRLLFADSAIMVLYDRRSAFPCAAVDGDRVLEVFDRAYELSREVSVTERQAQKELKEEIESVYEEYRGAIEAAYENVYKEKALKESD